ncbi:integrase domain-containing protein [Vibrio algivorus]|uniref:Tyrosine-type recombinase/integrase n=1 Tax=Vibrio algivorus TaxID=1667024 RepID=A0A557P6A3_9VIBR|nr:integrase domain-containing protein [Vibrio algivorus]TVO36196.1 tyrosine-type recombinase/integrase [Vibrio algivorus]
MARRVTPLTDTKIKNTKAGTKEITLSDGGGLQLRISPTGTKTWILKYHTPITKKRTNLTLGKYPDLSLANARKATNEARELLAQGIDPKEYRDSQITQKANEINNTLLNVAKRWFEIKSDAVTKDHGEDIWRSLENYIFPKIGNASISSITAPQVIALLKPVEASGKLDTVKRLSQRLNEVMVFAVNTGVIHSNPLAGIKAAFKKAEKKNNPALKPEELPDLLRAVALSNTRIVTKYLITWQLHTMTRPSEATKASWDEFDFENNLWIIPAERMKKRREHRIPLTKQMLALLEEIKPISGHRPFVFPADRNPLKPIHEQTANTALTRMGFKDRTTAHGLRALASTTLNAQGYDADVIEAALAHVDKDQVRSAYNRTDYLKRRATMMQWWSDHIEQASYGNLTITGTKHLKVM